MDGWLTVLSQLGFHARHISAQGKLRTWKCRQVEGITLHFRHLDLPLGDIVLLWNADNPARMAVDLGTGLERLAWARTRIKWHDLGITRRVIGMIDADSSRLGVSSLVRSSYRYWKLFGELVVPWPTVAVIIEDELGV